MQKNIVFIHLESVSQMAFWQYSQEMPVLFDLMQRSTSFSYFYSASTSSVMSFSDLLHGDSSEFDHLEVFPHDKTSLKGKSDNLFAMLLRHGYQTHGVQYGSFCVGDAPNNFWGVWPDACGDFRWHNKYGEMRRENKRFLEKTRAGGKPFALYFWNMNTHVRDEDPRKDRNLPYPERFRVGYRLLDDSVRDLLADLEKMELLEKTLIVVVGDHGDDLWRHGIYRGRSHIIDPYANICWCPFFIFNNNFDICISPQLISMIDIKPTISFMLGFAEEGRSSRFSGVNILQQKRIMAFTQSMFALQKERSDPAKAITKSYAVTNGNLRLMVSAPADMGDSGGLELFLEQWDYGNTRNMLDFCKLDSLGNIREFGEAEAVHPHFRLTFTPSQVRSMVTEYEQLREILHTFIRNKEQDAFPYLKGEGHIFPEELFTKARRRE